MSDDDADLDITPRRSQPVRRSRAERPQHSRSREKKHIRDDKSYRSSQSKASQSTRSKSNNKPNPKTMKELITQRKKSEAPVNRYKASNFSSMKADLLKDSDLLNKNEKLKKSQTELEKSETSSKPESQEKPLRDKSPEKERIPSSSKQTVEVTPDKSVKTNTAETKTIVTTTQVTTVKTDTNTDTNDTDDKKEWKVKEGNVFLDNMETQMAIETARDHIDNTPKRAPSRASVKIDTQLQNGHSPNKVVEKPASRTPSRISFRGKQEQSVSNEQRPSRAPSRSSLFITDAKPTKTPSRAPSRASLNPINELKNQSKKENDSKTNVRIENTVVTETLTETVNGNSSNTQQKSSLPGSKLNLKQDSRRNSISSIQPPAVLGIKQESRRNSVISTQNQKHVSGRTSVVGIATSNGRISPAIEKQRHPASIHDKGVNKPNETADKKRNTSEKTAVVNGDVSVKTVTNNIHMNGYSSPVDKKTENDKASPKTTFSKSVNVSENVTENVSETLNTVVNKNKQPVQKSIVNDRKRSVDHSSRSNNDAPSGRKSSVNGHGPESTEYKEKPKPRERPTHKKDAPKGKKISTGRRSRSRTPQRKQSINGTGDIKMDRNEYEKMGHDGNRPSRLSESKDRNPRGGRRRSSSGGRKASKGGRKRSVSSERKKSKSRFPDIRKKDGNWKISARSPIQNVDRSEDVEEYSTERVITPKPTGANQWKDLVEKYLRQPSPKVGRTDDRSLLDSNITDDDDDDDEIDIFKRAQMKYKLTVSQTDDDDSDLD